VILSTTRQIENQGMERIRPERGGSLHAGEVYLLEGLRQEKVVVRIHLKASNGDLLTVSGRITARTGTLRITSGLNELRRSRFALAEGNTEPNLPRVHLSRSTRLPAVSRPSQHSGGQGETSCMGMQAGF
jgi:hypothetical protein